jgi:hypothetical protein
MLGLGFSVGVSVEVRVKVTSIGVSPFCDASLLAKVQPAYKKDDKKAWVRGVVMLLTCLARLILSWCRAQKAQMPFGVWCIFVIK